MPQLNGLVVDSCVVCVVYHTQPFAEHKQTLPDWQPSGSYPFCSYLHSMDKGNLCLRVCLCCWITNFPCHFILHLVHLGVTFLVALYFVRIVAKIKWSFPAKLLVFFFLLIIRLNIMRCSIMSGGGEKVMPYTTQMKA